jgi:hypothetical protein
VEEKEKVRGMEVSRKFGDTEKNRFWVYLIPRFSSRSGRKTWLAKAPMMRTGTEYSQADLYSRRRQLESIIVFEHAGLGMVKFHIQVRTAEKS